MSQDKIRLFQGPLGLVIFSPIAVCCAKWNWRPKGKFWAGILFQTTVSPSSISHLMNSVAAAVDITGRLGLEHPEQSNLCNWSDDQKLTFVTISALNLTETILWGKGKYEYTLRQGTSLNRSFEMMFASRLVKSQHSDAGKVKLMKLQTSIKHMMVSSEYSVCLYFVAIIRRHTQRKGRLPSWDFQC